MAQCLTLVSLLKYEVIWGILVYGVEAVRSLSRSEQVKTLLAGQPYQPYEAEVTNSPISNNRDVWHGPSGYADAIIWRKAEAEPLNP